MSKEEIIEAEKIRGEGVGFERIRRITGYLVGSLDRFNSGKKAEEQDRVKHTETIAIAVTDVYKKASIA